MADVQEIESAIGENNALTLGSPLRDLDAQFLALEYFGISGGQCVLVRGKPVSSACTSSSRVTVAVPRFITTMPPA